MPYVPVILASASPRRAALLEQIGVRFKAIPSNVEETHPANLRATAGAEHVARAKALAVAASLSDAGEYRAVLGADTIVLARGLVMGKPRDAVEAEAMLRRLSGRTHIVVTGVALLWLDREPEDPHRIETWAEHTRVTFRCLSDSEIRHYVASGRPLDKAGAYGIQEDAAAFVSRIKGCYFNVVGLPLARLSERLWRDGDDG